MRSINLYSLFHHSNLMPPFIRYAGSPPHDVRRLIAGQNGEDRRTRCRIPNAHLSGDEHLRSSRYQFGATSAPATMDSSAASFVIAGPLAILAVPLPTFRDISFSWFNSIATPMSTQ